jgi:hypothetical protein
MPKAKNAKKKPDAAVVEVVYPQPPQNDITANSHSSVEMVIHSGDQISELLKSDASQWVKDQFREHVPALLPALIEGWKLGAADGNPQILRQMAEAMGILASPGGAPVITNVINNNNNVINESQQFSVDSIIRAMSAEKHRKASDSEVIDVEDLSGQG